MSLQNASRNIFILPRSGEVGARRMIPGLLSYEKVLLVEPDPRVANFITNCLNGAGAEVHGPVNTYIGAMSVLERQRIGLVICSSRWGQQPEAALLEEQLAALQLPLLQCDWHWDQAWANGARPRLQMRWPSSAKALVVALRALVMGVAHGAPRHRAG